jgi:peptidoglycan/xylan/chitin deacetylase (PgdA/CDA1 family)
LDGSGSVISTPPEIFRAQMRGFAARGYVAVRADELMNAWNGGATLPARPMVVTFDDGFANVGEVAVPVLLDLGFRATIFAISGLCGKVNDWPNQASGIPRLPLLSWSGLADIAAAGFEVGGHTMTHPDLSQVPLTELNDEMVSSKHMIEARLGRGVSTFAYPFGHITRDAFKLAQAHYQASFGTVLGVCSRSEDRHRLRRIDMYYFRSPATFSMFGTLAGRSYLGFRSLGRMARGVFHRGAAVSQAQRQ